MEMEILVEIVLERVHNGGDYIERKINKGINKWKMKYKKLSTYRGRNERVSDVRTG